MKTFPDIHKMIITVAKISINNKEFSNKIA